MVTPVLNFLGRCGTVRHGEDSVIPGRHYVIMNNARSEARPSHPLLRSTGSWRRSSRIAGWRSCRARACRRGGIPKNGDLRWAPTADCAIGIPLRNEVVSSRDHSTRVKATWSRRTNQMAREIARTALHVPTNTERYWGNAKKFDKDHPMHTPRLT